MDPKEQHGRRRPSVLCWLALATILFGLPIVLLASGPDWWHNATLTTTGTAPVISGGTSDFAVANQGQLKNMAVTAVNEFNAVLPGGAGTTLNNLAISLTATSGSTSDFSAINLGQLKAVAKPFYDRLISVDYSGPPIISGTIMTSGTYPWASWGLTVSDYSAANLGQLKNLFSFDLTYSSDGNLLPNWWREYYYSTLSVSSTSYVIWSGSMMTTGTAYELGLDPIDYYDGTLPSLSIHGGNNQSGEIYSFLPSPLVVSVTGTGSVPLHYAPVVFMVSSGSGGFATSGTATELESSLTVLTDSNGFASAYFKPLITGTSEITAAATSGTSSTSVTFTETAADFPRTGLALWLEGDSGVSTSGSSVTGWADLSGSGNNAASTGNPPVFISGTSSGFNGHAVVQFNSVNSDSLWIPQPVVTGTSAFTWVFVAQWTGTSNNQVLLSEGDEDGYAGFFAGRFGPSAHGPQLNTCWSGQDALVQGLPVTIGATVIGVSTYDGQASNLYINGIFQSGTAWTSSDIIPTGKTSIGCELNGAGSNFVQADIAEILVFDRALSQTELNQVVSYLSGKYALVNVPPAPTNLAATAISGSQVSLSWDYSLTNKLTQFSIERSTGTSGYSPIAVVNQSTSYIDTTATAGTTYDYCITAASYVGSSGTSNTVSITTPEYAPGIPLNTLALWLKADSQVNVDGSGNVCSWIDQSGNGNNALQTTGNGQPQLIATGSAGGFNERPALQFTGTNDDDSLWIPQPVVTGTSAFTWVYVARWTGTSGNQVLIAEGNDNTAAGYLAGVFGSAFGGSGLSACWPRPSVPGDIVQGPPVITGATLLGVSTYDGQTHDLYINGIFESSTSAVAYSNIDQGGPTAIGCDVDSHNFVQADIAEIMVFNRGLTAEELQALNQYLAAKYLLPSFDVDGDGLSIGEDISLGLSPFNPYGNGDGLTNGENVALGIDPTNLFLVGNGFTNAQNIAMGIDPLLSYIVPPPDSSPTQAPTITLLSPPNATLLP